VQDNEFAFIYFSIEQNAFLGGLVVGVSVKDGVSLITLTKLAQHSPTHQLKQELC